MGTISLARISAAGFAAIAIVGLMLLGAAGFLGPASLEPRRVVSRSVADGELPVGPGDDSPATADQWLSPGAAPRLDLAGDEVSPAVATYGIDREGNLFEVHSPRTEEPRLGSPVG